MADLDKSALEAARLAVEDMLVEFRDSRMFVLNNNGFVIKERDGTDSSIIRLSTAMGLSVGIRAYLAALARGTPCATAVAQDGEP
jgi:hypothetical protein